MYVFKNALKNIMRNKGRNILMSCIIFAIIATSVVSLCIYNTSSAIIDDYKTRFSSEVTIATDMQKLMQTMGGTGGNRTIARAPLAQITPEQYLSFAESEYLQKAIFTSSVSCWSDTVTAVDQDAENDIGGQGGFSSMAGGGRIINGQVIEGSDFVRPTFSLRGGDVAEFADGQREFVDGEMYSGDNECIISSDLAELNGLKVNDTIVLSANAIRMEDDEAQAETVEYTLTITGIYLDATDEYPGDMPFQMAAMNRRNEILTSFETVLAPFSEGESGASVEASYYLKDPSMLSAFESELRAKGLSDDYTVSTDEESYNRIVKPVEGMRAISLTFMLVVLGLGAVILILLSSIAVRERKYEIGVLRAMGMKKNKVALGLWTETLAITAACLLLGLGVGALVTQPVSDVLLKGQIESAQEARQTEMSGPGGRGTFAVSFGGGMRISGTGQSDAQMLEELDVSLGADTVAEMVVIAILLASVAGMGAIMKITKYEPIKILMERS